MIFYGGIDPGKKGALALLHSDGRIYAVFDTPIVGLQYDENGMRSILYDWRLMTDGELLINIEGQQAMHKGGQGQSARSTFKHGEGYGFWRGLLAGMRIPYTVTYPRSWQAELLKGVHGADSKAKAFVKVSRLWPNASLKGPKGGIKDGRADALLLAEMVRRTQQERKAM